MGREGEQTRIFCDGEEEEEEDRGGIGHSSSLMVECVYVTKK